jgi:tetratricopeptide (TPR) repeat protein
MRLNKIQLSLIAGSVILVVLLLFANTKIPKKDSEMPVSEHSGAEKTNFSKLFDEAIQAFTPEQKQQFDATEAALSVSKSDESLFENTVQRWDSLRQPLIAAHYKEKQALAFASEKNWEEAGKRYYALAGFMEDEKRVLLFEKAILCFEKVLTKNPNNVDVKIDLASCYVEKGSDPMKGIAMLRELEKTDSTNVKLQLNFAFFSVKSGQWDKAIMRFEKALKLQPDYIEIYLHLADAYTQKGDKGKVLENLEKYVALTDDLTLKQEVKGYINKLKIN